MNNLTKTTITTLEVAEMMEVPHGDLLKKIEGRKDRRGYIQIMTEGQMSVSDFFIPSSYKDPLPEKYKRLFQELECIKIGRYGVDYDALTMIVKVYGANTLNSFDTVFRLGFLKGQRCEKARQKRNACKRLMEKEGVQNGVFSGSDRRKVWATCRKRICRDYFGKDALAL